MADFPDIIGNIQATLPALQFTDDSYALTGELYEVELPLLESDFSGEMSFTGWFRDDIELPLIRFEASGYSSGTLDVTLPTITFEATGTVSIIGTFDTILPLITVSMLGSGELDVTLPALVFEATGYTGIIGNFDSKLPNLSASLIGDVPIVGSFSVTLPSITASIAGLGNVTGTLATTLPLIRIASSGYTGIVGTLTANLPVLSVDADGYSSVSGTITVTLPVIAINVDGYVSSDTNYIICLNVENFGVSEYSNYEFDSFAEFNGTYLGCKGGAIYSLTGTTDNATPISATMRTATTDFVSSLLKTLSDVYVGLDSTGGRATVQTVAEETVSGAAQMVVPTEVGTSRVMTALGKRARHWAIQVSNYGGSSIEITDIDVRALVQSRRVK